MNYVYKSLTSNLAPIIPSGDTPILESLTGSITYMQQQTGEGTRVVVLVTDGYDNCPGRPNGIKNDQAGVVAAALAGYNGNPPVLTYTIGFAGADPTQLQAIVKAGTNGKGTNTMIDPTSTTYIADIVNALEGIGKQTVSCSFNVPAAPAGQTLDPNAVTIQLTVNGSTSNVTQDTTNTNGWNYTSGGAQITLFGDSCNEVKTDTSATIQILAGCMTEATTCGVTGASCSGGENSCCLGYNCNSSSNACQLNTYVVQ
jgi:hypothetical protein